jgi:hypothetical protein
VAKRYDCVVSIGQFRPGLPRISIAHMLGYFLLRLGRLWNLMMLGLEGNRPIFFDNLTIMADK